MSSPGPTLILDERPQKPRRRRALTEERFFESVLESISDRVCVLDRNGAAIYTNRGAETFAASSPDPLDKLAVGNNYVNVAESAVREGIAYAAERLPRFARCSIRSSSAPKSNIRLHPSHAAMPC
jgi:PAS domain-containing protein